MAEADEQGVLNIVAALLSVPPGERNSRLRDMCGDDGAVRVRVVSVLRGLTDQISSDGNVAVEPNRVLGRGGSSSRMIRRTSSHAASLKRCFSSGVVPVNSS